MAEKNIRLPPDSTGQRFRLVTIQEADTDGATVIDVSQEVVVLADEDGNIFKLVSGGSTKTSDPTLEELMRGVLLRLDILNAAVDSNYVTPDELGLE